MVLIGLTVDQSKARREYRAMQDRKGFKAHRETKVYKAPKVTQGRKAPQALTEPMEQSALKEQQVLRGLTGLTGCQIGTSKR
jgi:hypothetical protein